MLEGDVNQADWLMNNLIKQHPNNPVLTLFYDFTSLSQTTLFRNSQQLLDLKLMSC